MKYPKTVEEFINKFKFNIDDDVYHENMICMEVSDVERMLNYYYSENIKIDKEENELEDE